jgi:lipoprotein signal peptidase
MRLWKTGLFSLLLGSDLLLKQSVEEQMKIGEKKELLDGHVIIRKVYNRGFVLNTMEDRPELIKGASCVAGAGVALYDAWLYITGGGFLEKLGAVLFSAGAASNVIDRLFRGKVIDYIGVRSKNSFVSKITANLGDFYIAAGAVFTVIGNVFRIK